MNWIKIDRGDWLIENANVECKINEVNLDDLEVTEQLSIYWQSLLK